MMLIGSQQGCATMRPANHYLDATHPLTTYPIFANYNLLTNTNPTPFYLNGDTYFCARKLGSGVYGSVWLFKGGKTGKSLALKCESRRPTGLNNTPLEMEASVHSALYGFGHVSANKRYLLTDYFEGSSGNDFLLTSRKTPALILRIWILIAAAFKNLHEAGFVHCDGHLENIIVAQNLQEVFLIDFGFSCTQGQLRKDCDLLPKEAKKSRHLPPENFKGHRPRAEQLILASAAQDAYSVGWHLLVFVDHYRQSAPDLFTPVRELRDVANQLMATDPLKRISIQQAISFVITSSFPEKIYSKPEKILMWTLFANTIFQMRQKVVVSLQTHQAIKEHRVLERFINDLTLLKAATPETIERVFIDFSTTLLDHEIRYPVIQFVSMLFVSLFKPVKALDSKPAEKALEKPVEVLREAPKEIVLPAAATTTPPTSIYVVGHRPRNPSKEQETSPRRTPAMEREVTAKITRIKFPFRGPLLTPPCILERRNLYTSPVNTTIRRRVWREVPKDTVGNPTLPSAAAALPR